MRFFLRPDRYDKAYLWDMLDAARSIMEFVSGRGFQDYKNDKMLRSAVERCVEIIGEAARKVSPEMKGAHPEIPWRSIISQRNIIAHDYGEIDDEIVWELSIKYIPELIDLLRKIVPEEIGA
jgi:uncharacterized protein with HEPN domain